MLSIKKGNYDKFQIECLRQIIKKGNIVVDLGANIGYYTLILAKLVGKSGHVFAFEPEPSNFKLLSKNVEQNKHHNVTLIQKAVSNKSNKSKLYVSKRNMLSHRIFDAEDKRNCIDIAVITLDEYFEKLEKPINFIKMDVEGAEYATLYGASKIIENSKNLVVMMEYFPKWIKKFGYVPEELLVSLKKKNFELFDILQTDKKLKPLVISNFIEKYSEKKKNYTNILCVRGEKLTIKR